MQFKEIVSWLLDGDISIQYQTHRDLLNSSAETLNHLRQQIAHQGYGKQFLAAQNANGHWGRGFYQPKWTSTHYTLLDLRNLDIEPTPEITRSIDIILADHMAEDGGINPAVTIEHSDVCVNGMFLNYAAFFQTEEAKLKSVVDFILSQHMKYSGFNCRYQREGAVHASLHSTICVLEGLAEYMEAGYSYRRDEIRRIEQHAIQFILEHRLYKSDHTGKVINPAFTMLSFPYRWHYDILRALDYMRRKRVSYDDRMEDAISLLHDKRMRDGRWPVQAKHPGEVHFDMEQTGKPSRWNTLRALRILERYDY